MNPTPFTPPPMPPYPQPTHSANNIYPFVPICVMVLEYDDNTSLLLPTSGLIELYIARDVIEYDHSRPFVTSRISAYKLLEAISDTVPAGINATQLGLLKGQIRDFNLHSCIRYPDNGNAANGTGLSWNIGSIRRIWLEGDRSNAMVPNLDTNSETSRTLVSQSFSNSTLHIMAHPINFYALIVPTPSPPHLSMQGVSVAANALPTPFPPPPPSPPASASVPTPSPPTPVHGSAAISSIVLSPAIAHRSARIAADTTEEMLEAAGVDLEEYYSIPSGQGCTLTDAMNRVKRTIEILELCGSLKWEPRRSIENMGSYRLANGTGEEMTYYSIVEDILRWKKPRSFNEKARLFEWAEKAAGQKWKAEKLKAGPVFELHRSLVALFARRCNGDFSAPRREGFTSSSEEAIAARANQKNLNVLRKALGEKLGE
ncbi:hypothetical protein PQX77_019535 [Marasmius sp. AFHP31]|nr:hypothetical protein PQX77_019535 [Marasmius sp. AFHP31]